MAIPVKLPVFEGPLDLLMHLIEKNKIDIYDIPIVEITDQYLEYVHQMDHEDMDVTSEFLVMAATLLDIKSLPGAGRRALFSCAGPSQRSAHLPASY